MPKLLKRYQESGSDHFVTFSCYHRLPHLDEDQIRITFLERLEWLRQRHEFYVFGYVLMPEHVHLLVSEPKRYSLAATINVLKCEVSKHARGGRRQFWQTRYYDFNV